jgi:hypothetical protein
MQNREQEIELVVQTLRTERFAVDAAIALERAGIPTLLLKGPILGRWLYPDDVRIYEDADLLVHPVSWGAALAVFDRQGFKAHPRSTERTQFGVTHARTLEHGGLSVDLHRALPGLKVDGELAWQVLFARAEWQNIVGFKVRAPDRAALLLHIALHAAQHVSKPAPKPQDDLRRAIEIAAEEQWRCALELAQTCEGVTAFACGLKQLPEGHKLLERLGVKALPSLQHELRRHGDPIAEEIGGLLWFPSSSKVKVATMRHMLFPGSEYLRNWSTLATRGKIGLAACWAWRPLWAMSRVPRAALIVLRVYHTNKGKWDI